MGGALAAQRVELAGRLDRETARIGQLEELPAPAWRSWPPPAPERALAERAQRARLAERSAALAALRRDIEVRAAGLEQRRTMLSRRRDEIEGRLRHDADQRRRVAARREEHARTAVVAARLAALVASRVQQLDALVAYLREARGAEAERRPRRITAAPRRAARGSGPAPNATCRSCGSAFPGSSWTAPRRRCAWTP